MRTFPRTRNGRIRSGSFHRSAMIAMCAVVNESIAPYEYMSPRKADSPEKKMPGTSRALAIAE